MASIMICLTMLHRAKIGLAAFFVQTPATISAMPSHHIAVIDLAAAIIDQARTAPYIRAAAREEGEA
jgi:hypothetical protein